MPDWNSHCCHWELIRPSGELFPSRGRHAMASIASRLFVVGGNSEANDEYVDVWCLSVGCQSNSWKKVSCMGELPMSRTSASLVSFDNWECTRDLYKFRVFDNLWTLVAPVGDSISARNSHTMVLHSGSSTMYVFGGWDNNRTFFNDLFALHCYGTRWTQISPRSSTRPSPRMGHASVVYRNSILVFGGWEDSQQLRNDVWEFSLASMSWIKHQPNGTPPSPRYRHTAVVSNDCVFVMGGTGENKQRFNDVYIYDISQEMWHELAFRDCVPPPRSFHQAEFVDGAMYVVGGMFGTAKLNDVFRLVTPNFSAKSIDPIELEPSIDPILVGVPDGVDLETMQKKLSYYESKVLCKVCFSNEINCVLLPCTHRAVCMSCASEIVHRENPSCPICRITITRIFPTIDA